MSFFDDVESFHRRFGLPTSLDPLGPALLDRSTLTFRVGAKLEELSEMMRAESQEDLPKVADGLVDLVYFALGTAALMRLPFNELWAEVHRANMAKVRATGAGDGRSARGHSLDVVKPAGWTPPDVEGIVERAILRHAASLGNGTAE